MSIENRPYIGSWGMRDQTLVRYTPDCLVYINGYLHIPGCRACNGSIDFQKYITQVTVDPSINAVANATISMSIPAHASEAFTGDGNYLLRTGLFVTVYMRGYFPMSGIAGKGEQDGAAVDGFDPTKVPVYPYYQVFRGVVTEVSHEYNGGMYSVSMSCSDFLHFWSNLKVATNGALFGPRPDNSNVQVYLKGHRFTGASPYSIIYSLFRIGFGSSGGVEFTMGRKTNIASVSDATGSTLSKMAGLNQERLFNSRNVNLRMYGMDGTLYNLFTQAYLGAFQSEEQKKVTGSALATAYADFDRTPFESTTSMKVNARALGFNPLSTIAAVGTPTDQPATVNVLQMQAFVQNIQSQGQVNQFETDYMTKLEIAQAVCEVTGFEFYQDVDGDIVFKPAFYNMDTRQDPVYVIKDRDLISLSESDSEPEATYITGTGSHFRNVSGTGLEGWLGVAAMYADYRLIADFGWREATFDTAYLSDARAIYISAINRLDIVNSGRRSSSITIPMRPELRPGYPIYIESIGAYYYIEAISHSFQFGGQCTSQITGTAKRAKFHAPGMSGGPITIDSIQLDNPYLPACPLSSEGGADGPPRYIGFPNVVLSLDPDYLNPKTMLNVRFADSVEALFQVALSYGVIEFTGVGAISAKYDGEFVIRSGNESTSEPFTKAELETQWTAVDAALKDSTKPMPSGKLGEIVAEIQRRQPDSDQEDLINYLVLLNDVKARVAPGMSLTGNYRYYSCSHPTKAHQGQKRVDIDQTTTFAPGDVPSPTNPEVVPMFVPNSQVVEFADGTPTGGIEVTALDSEGASSSLVLQTSQIKYVTFAKSQTNKIMTVTKLDLMKSYGHNLQINPVLEDVYTQAFISSAANGSPEDMLTVRLQERWDEIVDEIQALAEALVIPGADIQISETRGYTRAKARYAPSLEAVLDRTRGRSGSASKTAAEFYGTTDQEGVGKAAGRAGKMLYELTKSTMSTTIGLLRTYRKTVKKTLATVGITSPGSEGIQYDPSFENVDPIYRARDIFINAVTDGSTTFGTSGGQTTIRASFDNTSKQTVITPVFPVSDAMGFEVYGSFAYGRGLTVASYVQLLQSAGADGTVIGGTGDTTSLQTLLAVEKYLDVLRSTGGTPQSALDAAREFGGALAAEDIERAIEAEGLEVQAGKFKSTMPTDRSPNSAGAQAHISGVASDSSSAEQSTLAANAPQELANIDPGTTDICNCKGAEAMFFLQAFSGEYAKLESNEAVQEFLEAEVMARAIPWELSREAMAGQIRDSNYTSLGEKFQKMGSDYGALFSTAASGLESVPAQFEAAGEDLEEAFQQIDQALGTQAFTDDD
jgi:hypothetical protein